MRKIEKGNPQARYETDKEDSEYVTDDASGHRARLTGDQMGLSPAQLLEHARGEIGKYDALVEKLLQHLPRRFEDRVKALREPKHRAERSLAAAAILLENAERALRPGDPS